MGGRRLLFVRPVAVESGAIIRECSSNMVSPNRLSDQHSREDVRVAFHAAMRKFASSSANGEFLPEHINQCLREVSAIASPPARLIETVSLGELSNRHPTLSPPVIDGLVRRSESTTGITGSHSTHTPELRHTQHW